MLTPRLAYVEARVKEGIAYRFNLLFQLLNPVLFLVLYSALWQAIYNGRAQVDGISSGVMGTYIVLSAAHTVLNRDDLVRLVRGRVRTGQVGVDLTSPLPLLEQQFLSQIGHLLVRVPVLPPILAVGVVAAGLTGPDSPATLGMYLLSMVLGWLVNCCIWLLIAAVSFWTLELGGMTFLYTVVSQFLSGAIIPLWFMPEDFRRLLEWLPHQATLFTPIAIYLGTTEGIGAWRAIAVQAGWLLVLGVTAGLVWRHACRRLVVQGG